jgi:hypothetical protein
MRVFRLSIEEIRRHRMVLAVDSFLTLSLHPGWEYLGSGSIKGKRNQFLQSRPLAGAARAYGKILVCNH